MLRKRIGAKEVFRAVCLATKSALLLPWETRSLEVWWPRQWTTATSVGKLRASSNLAMRGPLTIGVPLVVRNPRSCQRMEWVWVMRQAYLESVYIVTHCPLDRWSAQVRAISSAFGKWSRWEGELSLPLSLR